MLKKIFILLGIIGGNVGAITQQYNVRIIHFFERGNPWPTQIDQGFRAELIKNELALFNEKLSFQFESVYLPDTSLATIIKDFDSKRPDLVLLTDDGVAAPLMPELMSRKIPTESILN